MPAILAPVKAEASKESALRSSTSRLCTDDLPQAFASAVISMLGARMRVHTLFQLGVLRGDADRAHAGVAVMAGARRGPELAVVVEIARRVAAESDHRRVANHHRVGAQRQAFRRVRPGADATRSHEADLFRHAAFVQRLARGADGAHGGNAGVVETSFLTWRLHKNENFVHSSENKKFPEAALARTSRMGPLKRSALRGMK